MKKFIRVVIIFVLLFYVSGCTYRIEENRINNMLDKKIITSTVDENVQTMDITDDITSISIKNTSLNNIEVDSCQKGVTTAYQIVFVFYFANNSGKDCSFDDIYTVKLYQGGVECYQNYTPLALTANELNGFDKNVRSGYTIPVKLGYNVDLLNNLELVILSDGNEIANYYVEVDEKNREYIIYEKDITENEISINVLDDGLYGYYDNIGGMNEFYFEWMENENCYKLLSDGNYEETLILYNNKTGIWFSGITMQFEWEIKENSLCCTMEDGWYAVFQKLETNDKYSNYDYNSTYQEDSELIQFFLPELLEEYLSDYIYNNIWINSDGYIVELNKDTINDYSYKILNAHGYFYRNFSISFDFVFSNFPNELHSVYCDLINSTISIDEEKYVCYDN